MLSRRTFIKSALVANAALLTNPSQALQLVLDNVQGQPLLTLADEKSPAAKQFITHVSYDNSSLGLDIGVQFERVKQFCSESPNGLISGLTRDSDFFVIEQLAKDYGFYPSYSANHIQQGNNLSHEVSASQQSADLIAHALAQAGEQWPVWLAHNTQLLPQGHQPMVASKSQIQSTHAAQDFLVSWSLSAAKNT